ncbi:putative serine/threonine-protein kinase iks1 [Tulasnella sp. JGI-2019a]|nr:putative serine/threonine-protein kinase iks1 [Tulasnella sp. JGI-2019a]KAG9010061.1 putative serine/threonine-protein kinase iks1 [Tulasnella sp. JGI-2019a]
MMDSPPPTPRLELVPFTDQNGWHPILEAPNQVVLYNPSSHALTVTTTQPVESPLEPTPALVRRRSEGEIQEEVCPYCHRPLDDLPQDRHDEQEYEQFEGHSRVTDYFHLLAAVNESSRPTSPNGNSSDRMRGGSSSFDASMAQGYFEAFFREVRRIGMGANGTVWLCEHVLDGNVLGQYAVKKIAVGQSHDYLMKTLQEVRLLEALRHPNIITYHHSWLEPCQFSPMAAPIPTLFVLMQWAEGGSLDDFIAHRLGRTSSSSLNDPTKDPPEDLKSRSSRIRAFRAQQQKDTTESSASGTRRPPVETKAIHLLSAEELRNLFGDVVTGLAFLHDRSILHLDLKPGNVLLTWDEGKLIPRAMLSDFGTSQDMLNTARKRSGNTGTLEYTSPESLDANRSVDSKADMWSLGMILHKLLFFKLPYTHDDIAELESEVLAYHGFKPDSDLTQICIRRGLPPSILLLLQSLLERHPAKRPTCLQVMTAMRSGNFDAPPVASGRPLPVVRRYPPSPRNGGHDRSLSPTVSPTSPAHQRTFTPISPAEDLCALVLNVLSSERGDRTTIPSKSSLASEFFECELEEEALVLALRKVRQRRAALEEVRDCSTPPRGHLAIADDRR